MLQYLSSEEDLKQGYHLADLLTKVCFVHGDKELFEIFENKMYELLEKDTNDEILGKLEEQLNEDFENFAVRSTMLQLRLNKPINIKKVVYRSTTLFISALGRIYKIRKNSCFDIIEKLFDDNRITENCKHKLDYAIALACEVRLRWYMQRGRQEDVIESQSDQRSTIQTFTSLLGLENTISYFQIAYSLQCDVSKRFNLKKMHFHSDPQLFNQKILFGLNCEDEITMTVRSQKNNGYTKRFLDFDECLSQLKQNIEIKKEGKENKNFLKAAENYKEIADKCREQCRWDDAMEFYEMCICIIKELGNAEQSIQLNKIHRDCLHWIGYCLFRSHKYNDAINKYKGAILVCENLPQDNDCYGWIAWCLRWIGLNFIELDRKKINCFSAKKYLEQSLLIFQSTSIDIDCDEDISRVLQNLARYYAGMNQNEAGQKYYYERWMHIEKQKSSNNKSQYVGDNAAGLYNKGKTFYELSKYDEALESFKKSLNIEEHVSIDKQKNSNIASSLHWIGQCLYELNKYDEALESFKKSLNIYEHVSIDKEKDTNIASSLHWIGRCLYELNKYDEAMESFKKSLNIREHVSIDKEKDSNIASSLHWFGLCLYELNKYDEAFGSFKKSLNIYEHVSIDKQKDSNIASSLYWIGRCLYELNKYDEALESLKKSLNIKNRLSIDIDADQDIASTLEKIGDCLIQANKKRKAEIYHKRAKQIKLN